MSVSLHRSSTYHLSQATARPWSLLALQSVSQVWQVSLLLASTASSLFSAADTLAPTTSFSKQSTAINASDYGRGVAHAALLTMAGPIVAVVQSGAMTWSRPSKRR